MDFFGVEHKRSAKTTKQITKKSKNSGAATLPQLGSQILNPVPKVSQMSSGEIQLADSHLGLIDWLHWPSYIQRWSLSSKYGSLAGVSCTPTAVARGELLAPSASIQNMLDWDAKTLGQSPSYPSSPHLVEKSCSDTSNTPNTPTPNRPAVLLLPGITGSKEDFLYLLPLLAAEGFFVYSFDLPGQFESAKVRPQPKNLDQAKSVYDWQIFEETLSAVLRRLGKAHVVGLSFSGVLAQKLTLKQPEFFASLTLMSTPPTTGNGFAQVPWIGRLANYASGKVIAWLMTRAIYWNVIPVDQARLQLVRHRLPKHDYGSIQDMLELMLKIPFEAEEVADLSVPKLWMFGCKDLWKEKTMIEHANQIGAIIQGYETGHSPCETVPFQVTSDLVSFYRQIDSLQH